MGTFVDYPAYHSYYNYFCPLKNTWVVTDKYEDYLNHLKRNGMGGDSGVHFPKHDPLFQMDPNS